MFLKWCQTTSSLDFTFTLAGNDTQECKIKTEVESETDKIWQLNAHLTRTGMLKGMDELVCCLMYTPLPIPPPCSHVDERASFTKVASMTMS